MEQMQNPFPTFHQVMKGKFTEEDLWITPTVSLVRLSSKSSLIVLFLYQLFLGGLEANFHSHTFFWNEEFQNFGLGRQMPRISGHDLCTKKPDIFGFPLLKLNPFLDCKNPRNQRFHIVGSPTQSLLSISHRSIQNVDPPFSKCMYPNISRGKRLKTNFWKEYEFSVIGLEYLKRSFWHGSYYRSPILSYGQSRSTACLTFQIIVSTGGYPISKSIRTLIRELANRKLTD